MRARHSPERASALLLVRMREACTSNVVYNAPALSIKACSIISPASYSYPLSPSSRNGDSNGSSEPRVQMCTGTPNWFNHFQGDEENPRMSSTQRTWLVTGASSGLGAEIALAALQRGDTVVGTGRNIDKARKDNHTFAQQGGHWLALDVTSPTCEITVAEAVSKYNIDVLANNAGYAEGGTLEGTRYLTHHAHELLSRSQKSLTTSLTVWTISGPSLKPTSSGPSKS